MSKDFRNFTCSNSHPAFPFKQQTAHLSAGLSVSENETLSQKEKNLHVFTQEVFLKFSKYFCGERNSSPRCMHSSDLLRFGKKFLRFAFLLWALEEVVC